MSMPPVATRCKSRRLSDLRHRGDRPVLHRRQGLRVGDAVRDRIGRYEFLHTFFARESSTAGPRASVPPADRRVRALPRAASWPAMPLRVKLSIRGGATRFNEDNQS